MPLDDKILELKKLLHEYPIMKSADDFDNELEKRRKIFKEISAEVEELHNDLEHVWAGNAWKIVENKK